MADPGWRHSPSPFIAETPRSGGSHRDVRRAWCRGPPGVRGGGERGVRTSRVGDLSCHGSLCLWDSTLSDVKLRSVSGMTVQMFAFRMKRTESSENHCCLPATARQQAEWEPHDPMFQPQHVVFFHIFMIKESKRNNVSHPYNSVCPLNWYIRNPHQPVTSFLFEWLSTSHRCFPFPLVFGVRAVCTSERMTRWKVWPRNNIIFGLAVYTLVLEKMYLKDFNESWRQCWHVEQYFSCSLGWITIQCLAQNGGQ